MVWAHLTGQHLSRLYPHQQLLSSPISSTTLFQCLLSRLLFKAIKSNQKESTPDMLLSSISREVSSAVLRKFWIHFNLDGRSRSPPQNHVQFTPHTSTRIEKLSKEILENPTTSIKLLTSPDNDDLVCNTNEDTNQKIKVGAHSLSPHQESGKNESSSHFGYYRQLRERFTNDFDEVRTQKSTT